MSFMNFFRQADINAGIEKYNNTDGAVLLDVRGEDEYSSGHIPNAVNLPLQSLEDIGDIVPDTDTPVFTYCLSGARSRQAETFLRQMGYTEVANIGGISDYRGEIER